MPLTKEQIDELLAGEIKPNRQGSYSAPAFVPVQVGPIRFCSSELPTMRCTYVEAKGRGNMCLSPAWLTFQGKPHCNVHCLKAANEKLVELGVTE